MKYIILILTIAFSLNNIEGQEADYQWAISGGAGVNNYHGDLSYKLINVKDFSPAFHIGIDKLISERIQIGLQYVNGQLESGDRTDAFLFDNNEEKNSDFGRALNFKSRYHDLNLLFKFYFAKREAVINPYLFVGAGIGKFYANVDVLDADARRYYYWSDNTLRDLAENDPNAAQAQEIERDYNYETSLSDLDLDQDINFRKFQVPVGLGLKFRFSQRVAFHVESMLTYHFTDYLDGVGNDRLKDTYSDDFDAYAVNPTGTITDVRGNDNKWADASLYTSASLVINFKERKSKYNGYRIYPDAHYSLEQQEAVVLDIDTMNNLEEVNDEIIEFMTYDSIIIYQDPNTSVADTLVVITKEMRVANGDTLVYDYFLDTIVSVIPSLIDVSIEADLADTLKINSIDTMMVASDLIDSTFIITDTLNVDTMSSLILDSTQLEVDTVIDAKMEQSAKIKFIDTLSSTMNLDTIETDNGRVVIKTITEQYKLIDTTKKKKIVDTIVYSKELESIKLMIDSLSRQENVELNKLIQELRKDQLDYIMQLRDVLGSDIDSLNANIELLRRELNGISSQKNSKVDSTTQVDTMNVQKQIVRDTLDSIDTLQRNDKEGSFNQNAIQDSVIAVVRDTLANEEIVQPAKETKIDTVFEDRSAELDSIYTLLNNLNKEKKIIAGESDVSNSNIPQDTIVKVETSIESKKTDTIYIDQSAERDSVYTLLNDLRKEKEINKKKEIEPVANVLSDTLSNVSSQRNKVQDYNYTSFLDSMKLANRAWQKEKMDLTNELRETINSLNVISGNEKVDLSGLNNNAESIAQLNRQNQDMLTELKILQERMTTLDLNSGEVKVDMSGLAQNKMAIEQLKNQNESLLSEVQKLQQLVIDNQSEERYNRIDNFQTDLNQVQPNIVDSLMTDSVQVNRNSVVKQDANDIMFNLLEEIRIQNKLYQEALNKNVQGDESEDFSETNKKIDGLESAVNQKFETILAKIEAINNAEPKVVTVEKTNTKIEQDSYIPNVPTVKIFFASNVSTVDPKFYSGLNNLTQLLKENVSTRIEIRGYADPSGNPQYNLQLSRKRAENVLRYFTANQGISADRISVISMGEEDSSDKAYSRRVEVDLK